MFNFAFCVIPLNRSVQGVEALHRRTCFLQATISLENTSKPLSTVFKSNSIDVTDCISPRVFKLIAISKRDSSFVVEETFWRDVYQYDADRYYEACRWAVAWIAQGYDIEYQEIAQ